ncbi:MAG: hypothetical protein Q7R76_00530 [Candidatus Woesearchaeota archaeon]|nr:hypothetical protein [Candidatus Woesearchaeota archaeon]
MANSEHINGAFLYGMLTSPRITQKMVQALRFTGRTGREAGFEVHRSLGKRTIEYPLFKGDNRRVLTAPDVLYQQGVYGLFLVHTHPVGDVVTPSPGDLAYLQFSYDTHKLGADVSANSVGGVIHGFDDDDSLFSLVIYQYKDPELHIPEFEQLCQLEKRIAKLQDSNKNRALLGRLESQANASSESVLKTYFRVGLLVYRLHGTSAVLADATNNLFSDDKSMTAQTLLETFSFKARMVE